MEGIELVYDISCKEVCGRIVGGTKRRELGK